MNTQTLEIDIYINYVSLFFEVNLHFLQQIPNTSGKIYKL